MIKDTRLRVFLTNAQTAMLRHRDSIKQTTDAQPLLTSLLYTWGYTHTVSFIGMTNSGTFVLPKHYQIRAQF